MFACRDINTIVSRHPVESKVWCSKERTGYFIAGTYICVIIACIPGYMTFTISTDVNPEDISNTTLYKVGFSEIAHEYDGFLMTLHFWVFSVVTKLAPCILLTYLSLTLIYALIEADKRKKRLKSRPIAPPPSRSTAPTTQQTIVQVHAPVADQPTTTPDPGQAEDQGTGPKETPKVEATPAAAQGSNSVVTVVTGTNGTKTTYKSTLTVHSSVHERSSSSGQTGVQSTSPGARPQDRTKESSSSSANDRTNRMLIAVLLLFLITEFPSGILVLLSGIIGDSFFTNVYSPLGELMDILALVNSSINFILYCSMSSIFRTTFINIFCKCFTGGSDSRLNETTPTKSTPLMRNTLIKVNTNSPNNNRKGSNVTTCVINANCAPTGTADQHQATTNF